MVVKSREENNSHTNVIAVIKIKPVKLHLFPRSESNVFSDPKKKVSPENFCSVHRKSVLSGLVFLMFLIKEGAAASKIALFW